MNILQCLQHIVNDRNRMLKLKAKLKITVKSDAALVKVHLKVLEGPITEDAT